jgi:hypothetical protein
MPSFHWQCPWLMKFSHVVAGCHMIFRAWRIIVLTLDELIHPARTTKCLIGEKGKGNTGFYNVFHRMATLKTKGQFAGPSFAFGPYSISISGQ